MAAALFSVNLARQTPGLPQVVPAPALYLREGREGVGAALAAAAPAGKCSSRGCVLAGGAHLGQGVHWLHGARRGEVWGLIRDPCSADCGCRKSPGWSRLGPAPPRSPSDSPGPGRLQLCLARTGAHSTRALGTRGGPQQGAHHTETYTSGPPVW